MDNNTALIPNAVPVTGVVKITVVRGRELVRKDARKCYVVVTVDDTKATTKDVVNTTDWIWGESFQFNAGQTSILKIQVYGRHRVLPTKFLGDCERPIVDLLKSACVGDFDLRLERHTSKSLRPSISLRVEMNFDQLFMAMTAAVREALAATRHIHQHPWIGSLSSVSNVSSAADYVQTWKPFLDKLKMFDDLAQTVAEVHPFAKTAYITIAAAYKIIQAQIQRDAGVLCLVAVMDALYSFVQDAEPLKRIQTQAQIMTQIAQQTTECGHFITAYCQGSFGIRLRNNLIASSDALILEYTDKFRQLEKELLNQAIIQTEILVLRVLDNLQHITIEIDLQGLPHAPGATYQSSKACLPGTQTEVLNDLAEWINSSEPNAARVCVLYGDKGLGKSAIAHSVSECYDKSHRLGSSFFFDSIMLGNGPNPVFPTMALHLSDLDDNYRNALSHIISRNHAIRTTHDIGAQFENFITKPARKLGEMIGPIVLVIDGLDTHCDLKVQHSLLSVLSRKVKDLPANFRILLTTRTKQNTLNYFEPGSDVIFKSVGFWTKVKLLHYVLRTLSTNGSLFEGIDMIQCRRLVEMSAEMSDDHFPWIVEACETIQGLSVIGHDLGPSQRLQKFLQPVYGLVDQPNQLDSFYLDILSHLLGESDAIIMDEFKTLMAFILLAQTPLSKHTLEQMLGKCTAWKSNSQNNASFSIQSMSSLLSGAVYSHVPIQPLYNSCYDFLKDASRSQKFWIDVSSYNSLFASSCLQVLNTELQFNILHLKTYPQYNKDIPGLADHIWEFIPVHLQYACKFLAEHLSKSEFSMDLLTQIETFLHKHFLFWLEVLSLMDAFEVAMPTLNAIAHWVGGHNTNLTSFVNDALSFLQTVEARITKDMVAIYFCALLWWPSTSEMGKYYKCIFAHNGESIERTQSDLVQENKHGNWSATSKDSTKQITYSSIDHMLHVWISEVHDGRELEGDTDSVWSVAFSPDGMQIIAGSSEKIICIWNVETGKVVLQLKGHTYAVMSVAFSPDGKQIVSGSDDNTVCIWNTETGKMVLQLKGCTNSVRSVAFSPDGKQIVSGSSDKTIYIWNTETGRMVLQLKGHVYWVNSVAFSPDGKQIVSGSHDETICIWNAEIGKMVMQLDRHTDSVRSVAFSPDGKQIVSGSGDKTICIWNAETGKRVLRLKGHTSYVRSVAFSPDGKQLVSGSYDNTVRIWNPDLEIVLPLQGHICLLRSSSNASEQKSSSDGAVTKFKIELWSGDYHDIRASQNDSVRLPICGMVHRGACPSTAHM